CGEYQLSRARQQVTTLYQQTLAGIYEGRGIEPGGQLYPGSFLIALRPPGSTLSVSPGTSIPDIPTSQSWLSANSGKLVDVPAVTRADNRAGITKPVPTPDLNTFGGAT